VQELGGEGRSRALSESPKPVVLRRRLRTELRRAREEAGYTMEEVARRTEWSLSKVVRIEKGTVKISGTDLRALLRLFEIPEDGDRAAELLELGRATRQSSWWSRTYRPLISEQYLQYIEYEEAASVLHLYEPLLIPGLLQTQEYATAIIREHANPGTPEDMIRARIDIRLKRQELLTQDPPPTIVCVLDEAAVQRTAGQRNLAKGQIAHLISLARRPGMTIEIVPFSAGLHRGMLEPFLLLSFPGSDGDVLFLESSRDTLFSDEDDSEIPGYRDVFNDLRNISLGAELTLRYLQNLASQLSQ
jgi:transcriptional regulator with XRE-family HTH domain